MQLKDIYTVEYSTEQKCYHVDTLDKLLMNNLNTVDKSQQEGKPNNGYLLIGLFSNYEAAHHFIDYHRKGLSTLSVNQNGQIH